MSASSLFRKFSFKNRGDAERNSTDTPSTSPPASSSFPERISEDANEAADSGAPNPKPVLQQRNSGDKPKQQQHISFDPTADPAAEAAAKKRELERKKSLKRSQSKKLIQAASCTICGKEFTQPKTLPCEHTFCQNCIKPFINPKNLASCPICQKEHPVLQGDPSTLPVNPNVLRLLEKAKAAKSELKQEHQQQKQEDPQQQQLKKPNSSSSTSSAAAVSCSTCNVSLEKDQLSQFCLHCQKVYCSLDFESHAKLVRDHLDSITAKLRESVPRLEEIGSQIMLKLETVDQQADSLLEEKLTKLNLERDHLRREIEEKKKIEKQKTEKALEEVNRLIELREVSATKRRESNANQTVISQYMEVQNDFLSLMSDIEDLATARFELAGDSFRLMEKKVMKSRKISLQVVNNVTGSAGATAATAAAARMATLTDMPDTSAATFLNGGAASKSDQQLKFTVFGKLKVSATKKPTCAVVCPWNNNIYVCFPETKSVGIYDFQGKPVETIEGGNDSGANLLYPAKVAFSEITREVLVLDKWQNSICVLDSASNIFTGQFGGPGHNPGHLQGPCGLTVDFGGNIYVADTGNDRVQVLSPSGKFQKLIGGTLEKDKHGRLTITQSELSQPEDVSIGSEGTLIAVADTGNNRVRVYNISSGQRIANLGMRGKGNGQFDLPTSVEIHLSNTIIVGDSENSRLQVFTMAGQFLRVISGYKKAISISSTPDGEYLLIVEANNSNITLMQ